MLPPPPGIWNVAGALKPKPPPGTPEPPPPPAPAAVAAVMVVGSAPPAMAQETRLEELAPLTEAALITWLAS